MSVTEYEKSIIEAIITTPLIKVNSVSHIKDLGAFPFNEVNLNRISNALQNGEYDDLSKIKSGVKSFDDITVIYFEDGKDAYYTIIYDSWALEQYPGVIRIFPAIPT